MNVTSSTPPQRWTRIHSVLMMGIIGAGMLLRVLQFLTNRSLYNDEELLALNIGRRSLVGLLQVLSHDQSAPVLFLWLEKAMTWLFGMSELSLRFVPFSASLLLLIVGYLLARRLLSPGIALLAVFVLASSPDLFYFANEVKPYEVDALVAAVMIWVTLRVHDIPSSQRWLQLGAAGCIAIWLSSPTLFVLPGVLVALLTDPMPDKNLWLRRLVATASAWMIAGVMDYVYILRPESRNAIFRLAGWFPVAGVTGIVEACQRLGLILATGFTSFEFGHRSSYLATIGMFVVLLLGCVTFTRRRNFMALVLLAAPIVGSLLAVLFKIYPLANRLQLFVTPAAALLAVAALELTEGWHAYLRRALVGAAAGVLLLMTGGDLWKRATRTIGIENTRPLIATWRSLHQPGDVIYVAARAVSAWAYYHTDWEHPDTAALDWYARVNGSTGPAFRNAAGRGHRVEHDGWDLVRDAPDHTELLGVPSGMQITLAGLSQPRPDTGWAENETLRIRQAGGQSWLLFSHTVRQPREDSLLLSAMQRHGAHVTFQRRERNAVLYRLAW